MHTNKKIQCDLKNPAFRNMETKDLASKSSSLLFYLHFQLKTEKNTTIYVLKTMNI